MCERKKKKEKKLKKKCDGSCFSLHCCFWKFNVGQALFVCCVCCSSSSYSKINSNHSLPYRESLFPFRLSTFSFSLEISAEREREQLGRRNWEEIKVFRWREKDKKKVWRAWGASWHEYAIRLPVLIEWSNEPSKTLPRRLKWISPPPEEHIPPHHTHARPNSRIYIEFVLLSHSLFNQDRLYRDDVIKAAGVSLGRRFADNFFPRFLSLSLSRSTDECWGRCEEEEVGHGVEQQEDVCVHDKTTSTLAAREKSFVLFLSLLFGWISCFLLWKMSGCCTRSFSPYRSERGWARERVKG